MAFFGIAGRIKTLISGDTSDPLEITGTAFTKDAANDATGADVVVNNTTMDPVNVREGAQVAFGDVSVVEPVPQVHLSFAYNINPTLSIAVPGNGGTIGNGNGHANLTSGTSADGFSFLLSREVVKYNPGQGGMFRGECVFESGGVADSEQLFGIGSTLDGFFFGYNGTAFGVNVKGHGELENQKLTITTASTTAENVTITLNGNALATVAVTNSGDACVTAQEIAAASYFSLGTGWSAFAHGNVVEFTSIFSGPKTGSYSLSSATTAVGGFTQDVAGVVPPIDSWIPQADWNVDKMDGTGVSGMTLDPSKGNVFEIIYQSGYGSVNYYIENPDDGHFQEVHSIHYANGNTDTQVHNPTFGVWASVTNTGSTTDIALKTSGMAGFSEGQDIEFGPSFSTDRLYAPGTGTTERSVMIVRNKRIFSGALSRVRIQPKFVTLVSNMNTATTNCTFRIYLDGYGLSGCSYSDISTTGSVVEVDTGSTTQSLTGSKKVLTFILSATESRFIDLEHIADRVAPGTNIMITAQMSKSSASNEVGVTLNWKELF